jgi:outer membrane protein assembly factor BamB
MVLLSRIGRFGAAFAVAALGVISVGAFGGSPSIAWRVEVSGFVLNRPAVGPNGEIAVQSRELVVIDHDGTVRWRDDTIVWADSDSICDIDDQGRVYANSVTGIRAFSPSGDPLWTLPPLGPVYSQRAGPTVGPDGNVYFIDDGFEGYGFGSVTPSGDLRWNLPGFGDADTAFPMHEIMFFDGLAIGVAPQIPENCGGNCLGSGAMALRMTDGGVEWDAQTTAPFVPAIAPSGRILLPVAPFAIRSIDAADGSLGSVQFSGGPLSAGPRVSIRPDGVGFGVSALTRIITISPDDVATTLNDDVGAIMSAPEVSPDGSFVVAGTAESVLPSQGRIRGIDAETGEVLWSIMLPQEDGAFPQPTGHPRFSPDGSRVYMGVILQNRSFVYAIDLESVALPGDTNGDGVVNFADLNAVLAAFGQSGEPGFSGADLNGDGQVGFADLNLVLSNFSASAGVQAPR